MKRLVLPLVVALLLAGAGLYLLRRAPRERQVAEWLPGGTILFEEMPDLHRTKVRWPQTALAQIINEPAVQAFLEKPLSQIPKREELDKREAQMGRIDPLRFFFAVTDWSEGRAPKMIAGLSYAGNKEEVDGLVDEMRKGLQGMWPGGKSDIETYGSGEIETFTTPSFTAALAYRGKWLFIATDVESLKGTLDRFEGKQDPASLAQLPAFKNCQQHLPAAADNLFFLRPALMEGETASLMMMLNPTADLSGAEKMKQVEAIATEVKMEGEMMRDATYVIDAQSGDATPLARDILKLSSTDTIIAAAERMQGLGDMKLPDARSDPSGVLQLIESWVKVFSSQGLGPEQFAKAFGPEGGFLMDWPQGAMIPNPLVMVDVRDVAGARKFLDTLATLPLAAGVSFTRRDEGGISFYSLPPTGMGFLSIDATLGLTGHCVIGALSTDAVKQAAGRWDAGGAGLGATTAYQKAADLVVKPTTAFTYMDTKAFFDRIYWPIRTLGGLASMGAMPHLADYVDLGRLPAPEVIDRHLSPMVSSTAVKDGGVLSESVGPITATQAAMAMGATVGAAAVPLIEQQINGFSPFANPLNPRSFANPMAPSLPSGPGVQSVPVPSASASGGTP